MICQQIMMNQLRFLIVIEFINKESLKSFQFQIERNIKMKNKMKNKKVKKLIVGLIGIRINRIKKANNRKFKVHFKTFLLNLKKILLKVKSYLLNVIKIPNSVVLPPKK